VSKVRWYIYVVFFVLIGSISVSSMGLFHHPKTVAAIEGRQNGIKNIYLPLVFYQVCPSPIELTHIPPYGSFERLQGRINCYPPDAHKIAVYIFVSGWWSKPTFANPLTPINTDGTWECNITTGGQDHFATRIAAFLVPNGYDPPKMFGSLTLPGELFESSVASIIVEREPEYRRIEFSGRTWNVKASPIQPVGPGPNFFSDREEDVWVDELDRLHLTIVNRGGKWYSTEVFTTETLGFGTYTFTLASPVHHLDKNVVLGLFTWDNNAPNHFFREIDIEFAKWGEVDGDNAQFIVQPYYRAGNRYRFNITDLEIPSTHLFDWNEERILFSSYQGQAPELGAMIKTWTYAGSDIPPDGEVNARINLWLFDGIPPSDGESVEVIVEAFTFQP
jgi:hypothetical protein